MPVAATQPVANFFANKAGALSSTSAQPTAPTTGNNLTDMNSFLRMFLTQLQYQDPTNPLESYELASQLAQFSTVERLNAVNSSIQQLEGYTMSVNNAMRLAGRKRGDGHKRYHGGFGEPADYRPDDPA
jgi:flagellar basal-body rod modification protein FlgD